jgi:hypothetical protein
VIIAYFYEDFFLVEDKATMSTLEAEVHLIREFKDDELVELQVGGLIPDLGCTIIRDSKLFFTP